MVDERKLLILYGSQTGTAQEVGRIKCWKTEPANRTSLIAPPYAEILNYFIWENLENMTSNRIKLNIIYDDVPVQFSYCEPEAVIIIYYDNL